MFGFLTGPQQPHENAVVRQFLAPHAQDLVAPERVMNRLEGANRKEHFEEA